MGCYRRLLLHDRLLEESVPEIKAAFPVTIDLLKKTEADDYLRFRNEEDPVLVAEWLNAGHLCFVARYEGRIISNIWASIHRARIYYLDCEINLMPDEVYLYDSLTLPGFRGKSIIPAIRAEMIRYFRVAGYRRMITGVLPENKPIRRSIHKLGFGPFAVMGYIKIGPWRRDFLKKQNSAQKS